MTSRRARRSAADQTVSGIDRIVRNVQTGHFERSLSALTAAGALVTAAEIYFEHDSASFGNAAKALLKGDEDRWGVLKEGLMTKAREILPGGDH